MTFQWRIILSRNWPDFKGVSGWRVETAMWACVRTFKAATQTLHWLHKYHESGELFHTLSHSSSGDLNCRCGDISHVVICCVPGVCPETKHDEHLWPGWRTSNEFAFSPVGKMKSSSSPLSYHPWLLGDETNRERPWALLFLRNVVLRCCCAEGDSWLRLDITLLLL